MKIGESVQITLGVKNLEENIPFYENLGFLKLAESNEPWPWAIFTDGSRRIMVNEDGNIYTGISYFAHDYDAVLEHLKKKGITPKLEREVEESSQAIFSAPYGLMFGVIGTEEPDIDLGKPEQPFPIGFFGELSVQVADLKEALQFWEKLGFEKKHESDDPYPWAIVDDGLIPLGLHQHSDIPTRPTMAYFSHDQSKGVDHVNRVGLEIVRKMEGDNIVVEGPDGQLVFIFQWCEAPPASSWICVVN